MKKFKMYALWFRYHKARCDYYTKRAKMHLDRMRRINDRMKEL